MSSIRKFQAKKLLGRLLFLVSMHKIIETMRICLPLTFLGSCFMLSGKSCELSLFCAHGCYQVVLCTPKFQQRLYRMVIEATASFIQQNIILGQLWYYHSVFPAHVASV